MNTRRSLLQFLGGSLAASFVPWRALADGSTASSEDFFIFVHASGGWDVMLSTDPRNTRTGLIEPPHSGNMTKTGIRLWTDAPLGDGNSSFQLVQPKGSNIVFGPAIGNLSNYASRMTLFNGLAMNTVSHPDGTIFAATGRHLAGGRVPASSVDTIIASELGTSQLLPLVSIRFPSYAVDGIDPRAIPLKVDSIGAIGKVLTRSTKYSTVATRDAVTMMLSAEAKDLAKEAFYPEPQANFGLQLDALRGILSGNLKDAFTDATLKAKYPSFAYTGTSQAVGAINAAFALEAMQRNISRCLSFAFSGFDTHTDNYDDHATSQQDMFDTIAELVKQLDSTPHPTKTGKKLADHTHILIVSEFCRTPQINLLGGRDHYPNNSAIIISPKFKGNTVIGSSDKDQLLPTAARTFASGARAPAPPDILSTLLSSAGIEPSTFVRDGEIMKEILV